MRTFLQVIGTLTAIAALAFLILGIWVNDPRWAGTAFITIVATAACFCSSFEFREYVPHNERCTGC